MIKLIKKSSFPFERQIKKEILKKKIIFKILKDKIKLGTSVGAFRSDDGASILAAARFFLRQPSLSGLRKSFELQEIDPKLELLDKNRDRWGDESEDGEVEEIAKTAAAGMAAEAVTMAVVFVVTTDLKNAIFHL